MQKCAKFACADTLTNGSIFGFCQSQLWQNNQNGWKSAHFVLHTWPLEPIEKNLFPVARIQCQTQA